MREEELYLVKNESKLERGFELILEGLGLDWTSDPHFRDTPRRAARAWYHELCSGITTDMDEVTTFPDPEEPQLIIMQNIPVYSMCAHHLLPFYGHATVGYISGNHTLLGISKLSRIVNYVARRPQVQEQMTGKIAEVIFDKVRGKYVGGEAGVGVIIRARHMCMELRGVKHEGLLTTSSILGSLREEPEARAEFLKLAGI